jgi:hypothetical protein
MLARRQSIITRLTEHCPEQSPKKPDVTVHGGAENGRGIAILAAAPWSPPPQPWMEIHGRP